MLNRQLKSLVKTNLLFVNPQVTEKARRKGKTGAAMIRSILSQYIVSGLIFIVLYGLMMIFADFTKLPGLFTYYMMLFTILGFSQAITTILNVFFESKDLSAYLPLPFKQESIFLAKIIVISLTVVPFILPILVLFLVTSIKTSLNPVLAIFLAIISFIVYVILLFAVSSIVVFGLAKTPIYKKHKKLVTTGLLFITMIAVAISFMTLSVSDSPNQIDKKVIVFFIPWHNVLANFYSTDSLVSILGIVACLVLLYVVIKKGVLPKFYDQLIDMSSTEETIKRKVKTNQKLSTLLFSYNFQLIKNPNLLLQVFSSSLLFPIIFLIAMGINGSLNMSAISSKYTVIFFLAGLVFSYLITNPMSLVALLISLDKENYEYIQATPLSKKYYLINKYTFSLLLQVVLIVIITGIAAVIMHLTWQFSLAVLFGGILGSHIFGQYYFWRDYRMFNSHWTEITQLFSRGSGTIGMMLIQLVGFLGGGLLIGISFFLITVYPSIVMQLFIFGCILLAAITSQVYYSQKYWSKMN
ncbi:hypothetical protein ACWOAH_10085 [Vagococcus vulneris]|uniref:Uncharacterized protein n=1 Tax=Vagococcus vulneris TaxID=1977869 RepID=A0A429ZUF7_9ENTE|nr:hypothetical protein [Vagococcus vulneris]RST97324.1 hypothetical protein CBF37_10060 [Vagococcus vulneris]